MMIKRLRKHYFFQLLVVVNALAVLYHASLYLFTSKYIIETKLSHFLLERLPVIPNHPSLVFFVSIFLFLCLLVTMRVKSILAIDKTRLLPYLIGLEIILMFGTFVALQASYNGLVLFVFLDIFYLSTNVSLLLKKRYWLALLGLSFWTLLISNADILSLIVPLPSLDVYLDFLPANVRFFTLFVKKFLTSLNIVLFIVSLLTYIIHSISEHQKIEKELDLAAQVNQELNHYVAITEKMTEDRERKRISREIHDTLGHALTGISAGIDAIKVLIDSDSSRAKKQLDKISSVVREGLTDVRRSVEKLRPGALEGRTLQAALEKLISDFQQLSKLDITLTYHWGDVDLDITKEDIIFRIIQEAITNAVRHGHAKQVDIEMSKKECYYLIIQDDGCGVDDLNLGYGLIQMQERLAIIGGTVSFNGKDGFRIVVKIPKLKGEE